ncbi:LysR family transcriptional regulator [Xylophilus sp. Kf1]|nr:LysR family transcriptional regulator [Xylophilus sp. Kf1]
MNASTTVPARIDDNISFRKLETLLAFIDSGSLGRTADRLQTSAVSVHRALHSLEEGARCVLFLHQGRNLVPTEAALVLADVARDVLKTMAEGVEAARAVAGHAKGRLKLGSLYSLTIQLVPEVIVGLRQRLSSMQAELVLGSNAELLDQLRAGALDATLMALPALEPGIVSIALQEDDMFFAAPLGSPYADRASIDLRDCRDDRFVTLGDGFATQHGFRRAFEVAGYAPNIAMQVGDIFSLANLVGGGVGYTLLPGRVRGIFHHKLQLIALDEPFRARQTIGLSFLASRERDPDLLVLASICRAVADEPGRRAWA